MKIMCVLEVLVDKEVSASKEENNRFVITLKTRGGFKENGAFFCPQTPSVEGDIPVNPQ